MSTNIPGSSDVLEVTVQDVLKLLNDTVQNATGTTLTSAFKGVETVVCEDLMPHSFFMTKKIQLLFDTLVGSTRTTIYLMQDGSWLSGVYGELGVTIRHHSTMELESVLDDTQAGSQAYEQFARAAITFISPDVRSDLSWEEFSLQTKEWFRVQLPSRR